MQNDCRITPMLGKILFLGNFSLPRKRFGKAAGTYITENDQTFVPK